MILIVPIAKFGRLKSNFFAPKITKIGRFQVQKNGTLDSQNRKQRPLFCCQLSPKKMEWTLVSHEYHFRASFEPSLKIA